jgi:hypothetical protein
MSGYQALHRRLARLESSLGAQERASYAPDLVISLPWCGRQEEEAEREQALATLKEQVTREAEQRRYRAVMGYILIAYQQPDGSWLAEVPWNTPQQREHLAACHQQALQERQDRGYIRQGTAHPGTAQEDDE